MTKKDIQQALFFEMHKEIEQATAVALNWFGPSQRGTNIAYPPGASLTAEEKLALKNLNLSPAAQSALKKLVTDTASAPLFRLFTLMDGVADPESGDLDPWLGVDFTEKPLDSDDEGDMLHDEFFASFWEYKR
jgi:hypothetical protein